MYKVAIIAIAAIAFIGCSPLRKIQVDKHSEVIVADTTITAILRQEIERHFGRLEQTIVEYYPPTESQLPGSVVAVVPTAVSLPNRTKQAVKRIIKTEYTSQSDRQTSTDSLSHSRIITAARNDEQSQVYEQPNTTGTSGIKWVAACLLLLLLILIILKLKF